ncbi:MAG: dihydroxyacetone kinase phosphoryl donor subunit DhaM [Vicinamibacteria bacterium]|jgi:dihydroxyacetone kinase phosphotransfer subunit
MAEDATQTVGIVLVSHSAPLAEGLAELAIQMAGPGVDIIAAGGDPAGGLGTDEDLVRNAVRRADHGGGVVVLADLGSSVLTTRHVLESSANGHARLVDAPFVEGALAAAVASSAGSPIEDVIDAAEGARGVNKL